MDLVSVIIPHYKVDLCYLKECLDSITGQTYPNLEILLVDDGNEETTAKWMDEAALTDKRIQVLHQNNAGVSAARNAGLEAAKGDWIVFCDPDDWMSQNEVEILLEAAKRNQADLVYARFYKLENDTDRKPDSDWELVKEGCEKEALMKRMLLLDEIIMDGMLFGFSVVWGCMYRRPILEEVRFAPGMHPVEDEIFNLYALAHAKRVVLVGKKMHYYRNNAGLGVTRNFQANTLSNYRYGEREKAEFIRRYFKRGMDQLFTLEESALRSVRILAILGKEYFFHSRNPETYRSRKQGLTEYIREEMPHLKEIRMRDFHSWKHRCFFLLMRYRIYLPLEIGWRGCRAKEGIKHEKSERCKKHRN